MTILGLGIIAAALLAHALYRDATGKLRDARTRVAAWHVTRLVMASGECEPHMGDAPVEYLVVKDFDDRVTFQLAAPGWSTRAIDASPELGDAIRAIGDAMRLGDARIYDVGREMIQDADAARKIAATRPAEQASEVAKSVWGHDGEPHPALARLIGRLARDGAR